MRILAIDSAFDVVSVAVWADGAILAEDRAVAGRGQAEILMPMIERIMTKAGLGFAAIDRIAVTVGPGHFTGLRLGLAAARGLGLASGKPVVGVTTFEAVLAALPDAERSASFAVVAFETKRADLYLQAFRSTDRGFAPACEPFAALPQVAAERLPKAPRILLVGDGAPRLAAALARCSVVMSHAPALPHAATVARIAADRAVSGTALTAPPEPLYLRPPDVTTPRQRTTEWKTPIELSPPPSR